MDELRVICARFPLNELVSAECLHLAGSQPDSEGVAGHCKSLDHIAQSAYLSLGARCLAEAATLEALAAQVQALRLETQRFRIELLRTSLDRTISRPSAIRLLADAIQGGPDLEQPLTRFILVLQEQRLWFGEIIASCEHAYKLHDAKPYHTSNSMPARLARGLVNLVQPFAHTILDPFCGTGSILLEAQALGIQAHGVDINPKMTHFSHLNLAHFGYSASVEPGNALQCQHQADAVVTDLPYGRTILKIEQDKILEILTHLVELAPRAIYLAEEPLPHLLTQVGYREVNLYRVHKRVGMQRYVHQAFR